MEDDASDVLAERLAAELHDGLIQWLVAAKMQAEAVRANHGAKREITAESLTTLVDTLQRAVAEARQLLRSLHAPEIDGGYWHEVLRNDLSQMQLIASPTVAPPAQLAFALSPETEPLPTDVATTAYRLVREAVWNAQRHAKAGTITISAVEIDRRLRIEVADDGGGFDPQAIPRDRLGVRGMVARAERAGGTAELRTAPGQGTRIRFELPLEP